MASITPSAVRSATGLLTSAQHQRCMTPPSALPIVLASQYAATRTIVIANVPRNPARTPARSQSSRGTSDDGLAIERSLFMDFLPCDTSGGGWRERPWVPREGAHQNLRISRHCGCGPASTIREFAASRRLLERAVLASLSVSAQRKSREPGPDPLIIIAFCSDEEKSFIERLR